MRFSSELLSHMGCGASSAKSGTGGDRPGHNMNIVQAGNHGNAQKMKLQMKNVKVQLKKT